MNSIRFLLLTIFLFAAASSTQAQFTPGRVVVLQCGSSSSAGNSGFLNEYLPSIANQASPAYQVTLPNAGGTDSGTSIVFGNNSAFNHGISLSADGAFVIVGGYANTFTTVDTTSGVNSPRVVATVKYDGTYARPFSSTTVLSANTIRSTTSDGFGNFWGNGNSGTIHFNSGTTIQSTASRASAIFNGDLYCSVGGSVRAFSGQPTSASTTVALLTLGNASPSASGFAIPPNPTVGSVAYVGDVTTTSPATESGIKRYVFDGISWNFAYTIILPNSDKPQHLAADFSGAAPVIYAVHGVTTGSGNRLYAVTDPGPAAANATIVTLATAPANNAFRGVALSPRQPAAPVFTTQPDNATNNYGSTVQFGPVAATGANPNAWTWKRGSTTLTDGTTASGSTISGSTTPTLTIANITGLDAGTYFAIASNNGGNTSSTGAILALSGSSITTQLVSRTNVAGTTASFHVVSGGPPPLTYQWFHETSPLVDGPTGLGSTISGSSTDTLTISTVQDGDAGNYTVTVTDSSPAQSSSTATLTVVDPPAINIQPSGLNKVAGATASFTVDASGGALNYQWFRNTTALTNGPSGSGSTLSGALSSTLTITSVQDGDAGTYTVTVTNLAGNITSDPAALSVGHIPSINTPLVNATNVPGSTASFSVAASGSGTLGYIWKHNGVTLANDGFHIFGADTANLSVVGLDTPDARLYSVSVTNDYGTVSSSAFLTVVISAPQPNTVPGLIVHEPFNYPSGPFPASGFYSWENIVSTYNQVSGQPAFWYNASGSLNSAVQANDLANYNTVTRAPPGLYPWPGVDGNSTNLWYFSSAPNNNHLKFGGVSQTNGAAYFSLLLHVDQGSALNQGLFDVIAGFSSGVSDLNSGLNANTFNYKLCTQVDSAGDGYYLGVFKGNDATISGTSTNGQWALNKHLARGELHFIVGCYKFNSGTNLVSGSLTNDDVVSLWIDPDRSTFGAAESNLPAPDAGGSVTNWNNNAIITEFALRGSVAPASKRVVDLRIGRTWASVTGPYYPKLQIILGASDVTLAWPAKDSFNGFGYKLQTSADLSSWTDDPNGVFQSGVTNNVTETPTSPQFWRLFYPPRSGIYGQY
jgi:hypothetical protein